MSLPSRAPYALCSKCPLFTQHTGHVNPLVYGFGPERASLLLIGEAPGETEALTHRPFSGRSGNLLRKALKDAGLVRDESYVSNAVLCHPTQNATPSQSAIKACQSRLFEEVRRRQPKVIVALGGSALKAFGIEEKIAKCRGRERWRTVEDLQTTLHKSWPKRDWPTLYFDEDWRDGGVYILPTYHPAFILRSPDVYPDLVRDLKRAKFLLDQAPAQQRTLPAMYVTSVQNEGEALVAISKLRYQKVLACDIESTSKNVMTDRLLTLAYAYREGEDIHAVVIPSEIALLDAVRTALDRLHSGHVYNATNPIRPFPLCVWWNGKFDRKWYKHHLGITVRIDSDGMLAHYCPTPDMRVLKRDLTWVQSGELRVGDELITCEEHNLRSMLPGRVLATHRHQDMCYRITTSLGQITVSAGHMWPVARAGTSGHRTWRTTQHLYDQMRRHNAKYTLSLFAEPWSVDKSYEGGYLAGFLDGEGCISHTGFGSYALSFSQLPGSVLNRVVSLLRDKGFSVSPTETRQNRLVVNTFHGGRAALRALGMFRPLRLLAKADRAWLGLRNHKVVPIEAIEPIGEREVVGIETDTGTLILEGFLSHNCLDSRKGIHGLKERASDDLGADDYEAEIKEYVGRGKDVDYSRIPYEKLVQYTAEDVGMTLMLTEQYEAELAKEPESDKVYRDILLPAAEALSDIELAGVAVDTTVLTGLEDEFRGTLQGYTGRMESAIGCPISPNSYAQLVQVLYGDNVRREYPSASAATADGLPTLALPVQLNREHTPNTGSDACDKLLQLALNEKQEQFVRALRDYKLDSQLYRTYIKKLPEVTDADGRIRTNYNLHVTRSGRLSSSDPTNLQNLPTRRTEGRRIKGAFVAGRWNSCPCRLLEIDLSQAELRVAAFLSREPTLLDVYRNGRDFHHEVALRLLGDEQLAKELRPYIKTFNFAMMYGAEPIMLVLLLNDTAMEQEVLTGQPQKRWAFDEVQTLYDNFWNEFPVFANWAEQQQIRAITEGHVTSYFGRRRRFPLVTTGWGGNFRDVCKEAVNHCIQSTAADILTIGMIEAHRWLQETQYGRIVATVHDSMLVEVLIGYEREVGKKLQQILRDVPIRYGMDVPFTSDVKVGQDWAHLTKLEGE